MRRHTFFAVAGALAALAAVISLVGGLSLAQGDDVVEISLIHATTVGAADIDPPALYPAVITVKLGQTVRLFNTSADSAEFLASSPHDPVVIASDEDGQNQVFTLEVLSGPTSDVENAFRVENGTITLVEFVADQAGEFFITHRLHGHSVVGRLIVEE